MTCQIVVVGATGRMGGELISVVEEARGGGEDISVLGGIAAPGEAQLGSCMPGVELPIVDAWNPEFNGADVIVDFSSLPGTKLALKASRDNAIPVLVCTTGLGSELDGDFKATAEVVPVVRTRNTSLGINAMLKLVGDASKMLGDDFDVELVELHHRWKRDAPSGTAHALLEELARARGSKPSEVVTLGRSGNSAQRKSGEIGAQAVRGGDVAGEHTVFLMGDGERLEITHRATTRRIFAKGALRAALWLSCAKKEGKAPGIYSMFDVLEVY